VALHVDAPRVGARTDPVLLGQVLRNLLANALKFAPRGEVRISCVAAGQDAVVEVRDDGVGIAPEHLGRIFDEFYRVAPPDGDGAQGHGLGLAIVRRLVDLLGIALSVESTPGAGTRFRLSMPRAALPAANGEAGRRRRRAPAFAVAHRVLLLEDDPGLRQASRRWLAARGLDVAAAATGAEALRLAADGFAPDLVVCDLHLADGENGVDALQRLRAAAGRDLPALLLSGDSSEAARALARVEGVRMLLKPVDPDELLAELRRLLEGPRL
jgi:CheY-like chemotaxis protein/anti-sigma regulatory factor (Ser/Thr protein kinase)